MVQLEKPNAGTAATRLPVYCLHAEGAPQSLVAATQAVLGAIKGC